MDDLTHLDEQGRARMVDVGNKAVTRRTAIASAQLHTRPEVIEKIANGQMPKGDVLATARLAGIMAAKRTADLIPLCHPLPLETVRLDFDVREDAITISSTTAATARTGVEMEALTAVAVAALTIYDMIKAMDRTAVIEHIRLEEKSGGKSGHFVRSAQRDNPPR